MNKVVEWLQKEQGKLQKKFKSKIPKIKGYDFRGVWITATCRCGKNFKTPFHIRDNATCQKCGRRFYRRDK